MDLPETEFAAARKMMVDSQLRPNKVTDPRVLDAMRSLPRERFLPAGLASLAYADGDVVLPGGRALIAPMAIARLIQLIAVRPGESALVVGCGTGYGAAVLDACGARVTALEEDPALLALARAVLPDVAPGVAVVAGRLADGWKAAAPFDVILIEGAVEQVPDAVAKQLKRGNGRLVAVRPSTNRTGCAVIAETTTGGPDAMDLSYQPVFDCTVPVIPQLKREESFVF